MHLTECVSKRCCMKVPIHLPHTWRYCKVAISDQTFVSKRHIINGLATLNKYKTDKTLSVFFTNEHKLNFIWKKEKWKWVLLYFAKLLLKKKPQVYLHGILNIPHMQLLFMKRMLSSFFFSNLHLRRLDHSNGQILKSLGTPLSFYTGTFTIFYKISLQLC